MVRQTFSPGQLRFPRGESYVPGNNKSRPFEMKAIPLHESFAKFDVGLLLWLHPFMGENSPFLFFG